MDQLEGITLLEGHLHDVVSVVVICKHHYYSYAETCVVGATLVLIGIAVIV